MVVTDLPADVSYEDFEKLLNKFEDEDYIKTSNGCKEKRGFHEFIYSKIM